MRYVLSPGFSTEVAVAGGGIVIRTVVHLNEGAAVQNSRTAFTDCTVKGSRIGKCCRDRKGRKGKRRKRVNIHWLSLKCQML